MEQLYVLLIQWDIPIYFVCGVGLLFALVQLARARRMLRIAMFGLEREQGRALRNSSLSFIGLFGGVLGVVLYINLQIAPSLPAELLRPPTPTPNLFATPFSSPTPLGSSAEELTRIPDRLEFAPTATLAANLPTAVPPATTPDTAATPSIITGGGDGFIPSGGGCSPAVSISQPRPNSTVFGTIEFYGTADTANFARYQLEILGEGTSNTWVNVLGGSETQTAVSNGLLGAINLGALSNGTYQVRLVIFNGEGGSEGQCLIELVLEN
jgi:hypothetical protein